MDENEKSGERAQPSTDLPKVKDNPKLALVAINICSISFVVTSILYKKA